MKNEIKNDLLGVELLRFFAAFSVLIWHYQHFWYEGTVISSSFEISDQPYFSILKIFYTIGYNGVQLFWAISGYIFFYIYFEKIKKYEITSRHFFIKRFSRLYPLHFITLIIMLILQIVSMNIYGDFQIYPENNFKHFFLNLLFINHWGFQDNISYNGPVWSVSVEIAILIIFFIFSRFLNTLLMFLAAAVLLVIFINFDYNISECIFLFFTGGFLYLIKSYKKTLKLGWFYYYFTTFFLTFLVLIDVLFVDVYNFYLSKLSLYIKCIFVLLFFTSFDKLIIRLNLQKVCRVLGSWTYASYLIHVPIQLTILNLSIIFNLTVPKESNLFFFSYLLIVFFLSHIVFKVIEKPLQKKLRNKFLR